MSSLLDMRPRGLDERFTPHVGIFLNLAILQYELGRMANCIMYGLSARINKSDEKLARAHLAMAQSECADLLLQVHMMCERMGWDAEEMYALGLDRYKTRMQEYADHKI